MVLPTRVGGLDVARIEERTQAIGRELFRLAGHKHEHLTRLNRWAKQVLEWCLADPALKRRILSFVDCLPSLQTPASVVRHVREYFPTDKFRLPAALRLGVGLSRPGLLTARAASFAVRQLVEHVAKQFIAGAAVEDAVKLEERLALQAMSASFDVLGEEVISDREADRYAQRYAMLIEALTEAGQKAKPLLHLSIKPSSLSAHFDPISFQDSVERAFKRLRPIAKLALERKASITLDMEQYELRDLALELAKRLLVEHELGERLGLGIVIQSYLPDSESLLKGLLEWLRVNRRCISVRLVKGAYWDHEVAQAKQKGWAIPVYLDKAKTDLAFERITEQLLEACPTVQPAIASHNLRAIAHAMAVGEALGLPKDQLEFQFLYGMGEAIQEAVRELGHPVRIYAPIGELIPGMAYLVRRILENTANESFLRQDLWGGARLEDLIKPPSPSHPRQTPAEPSEGIGEPFCNFANRREREQFARAVDEVQRAIGHRYPLLIGARELQTGRWLDSINPAHPDQLIGRVAQAGILEVEQAVAIAQAAQPRWARTPVQERVALLRNAAGLLRQRRFWFAALEVLEVGKPWREADADVVEAIDYLEYYSRSVLELAEGPASGGAGKLLPQRPGESNRYVYVPRGVCAVIAPWNFPLGILTGMASAALVAGNVVILKPAEQSPVIAYHFARLLHEAGVWPDALQYLPGLGEDVGDALARHPEVRLVMFTGSKAVGISIIEASARLASGQRFIKHVVAEMGGKNAIIVDDDADLDAAIKGILACAFGYSGQKCSAASRLIVLEAIYDELIERLLPAVDELIVCDPANPACDMGPLIDADAFQRVTTAISNGAQQAKLLYQYPSDRLPKEGYFVGPALFTEVKPHSALAQEELFGPALCLFRAKSFAEALLLANDTDYALTGGVYSRSPARIQQAIDAFEVGNLYINRPITGAVVGRQPFGGYKLSGLGTKAGGPDYLLQLVIPKTICENTARHGMPLE